MAHDPVDLLSRYIKIDTTNPPGNETEAVHFFAEILDREGIEYKIYEPEPGRASLRAVIRGTGEKGPVILLNHMDVVPAQAREWGFDPFGGQVKDGFVHGRGALDMKGQGIMELLAFLDVQRQGRPASRDLIFLAVADEETGGARGAQYLLENHPEDVQAEVVLNEGGYGITGLLPSGPIIMVSTAEKGLLWLRLTRTGPPGHGSIPHGENALERTALALSRLLTDERPVRITPVIADYFRELAPGWPFLQPFVDDGKPETLAEVLAKSGMLGLPQIMAMVKNTISLNAMHAGAKTNVIPSTVMAELDIRLLPGQDPDEFVSYVRDTLSDDAIEVEALMKHDSTESRRDTEFFLPIMEELTRAFPEATIAPSLLIATSDSRLFRKKGIPSYGVCPVLVSMDEIATIHGIDERISVENLTRGTRTYTDLVKRLVSF
ncbi:M20/M25/M40 family metallo-hydrolase [Thermodesulfobacteriota bacterium]